MSEAIARARSAKASMYRTLVVNAAEHLFATGGYDRTRIQDIASASGVSLGTLYSVFDGKADILEAIHDERLGELFVLVSRSMSAGEPAAAARLLRANRSFIHWLTRHPDFLRIHVTNSVWSSNPLDVSEGRVDAWHRGIDLIASVIEASMREGDAYEGDPRVAARLMVAIQQAMMSAWVEAGMVDDADRLADRIETQIRRSLLRSNR